MPGWFAPRIVTGVPSGSDWVVQPFVSDPMALARVLASADLFVHAGDQETFGLSVLEAMACGTPVVASDLPVLKEVGGAAVEYCPVGDTEAWVRTVSTLLDERRRDPARWSARQAAGRSRARCFSWSQFAARLTDIYQALSPEP